MTDLPAPAPRQNEVTPPGVPSVTGLMTLAVGVVVLGALYLGRDIFLPIVLSVLLAFVIAPFVDLLRRWRVPRVPAAIVSVIVALGIVLSLGGVIGLQLAGLASDLPRYEWTVRQKMAGLREEASGASRNAEEHGAADRGGDEGDAGHDNPLDRSRTPPAARGGARAGRHADRTGAKRPSAAGRTAGHARHRLRGADLHPAAAGGSARPHDPSVRIRRSPPHDRGDGRRGAAPEPLLPHAARPQRRLRRLHRPGPVGDRRSEPAALGDLRGPHAIRAVYRVVHRRCPAGRRRGRRGPDRLVDGPDDARPVRRRRAGDGARDRAARLRAEHGPFAVVLSAIFWTWLWGPVGLLIATPLTLCLVVLGRHVERLEFLDVLLGDRPARRRRTFISASWPAIRTRRSNMRNSSSRSARSPRTTTRWRSRSCNWRPTMRAEAC